MILILIHFFEESTESDIDMAEFHGCIMLCRRGFIFYRTGTLCRLNLLVLFIICQMDFLFRRSGETELTVS